MKNIINLLIILLINSFFISISGSTITEFQFGVKENILKLEGEKEFSFIGIYDLNSQYKYLYIYSSNLGDKMYSNKANYKIYFKQIQNKDSNPYTTLNYLNSDYSSIDFNTGLFIRISDLKYSTAFIFVQSFEICNFFIKYKYTNDIIFPTYFDYTNFQLNQFILPKGKTELIRYARQHDYNDYLIILSKTSLRNIDVSVIYKKTNVTDKRLAYLYPNGCSVFADREAIQLDDIYLYLNVTNNNNKDELLLLGYMHHIKDQYFPNEIVNGFQAYIEGNNNYLGNLLISGDSKMKQYFIYQIFEKKLKIQFYSGSSDKGKYSISEYNSAFPYKVDFSGRMDFIFESSPKRSALYFQYLDYSENDIVQKSLQSLVTGVPKSMIIPEGKSIYHFLPKERDSTNLYFYLRSRTQEIISVSFKSCTSYPENCVFTGKGDNYVETISNIGLWYSLPRNKKELQLIYVYCEKECAYDIIMTYEESEQLFLFPESDYTKFISHSGNADIFALPVIEYFEESEMKSINIDLTIISGKAKLTLKDSKKGNNLDYDVQEIGKRQSYIITSDIFLKQNYYKKEIYAIVTKDNNHKNTIYNIMYGSGSTINTKYLSNKIVNIDKLAVSKSKIFTFINPKSSDLYITISTQYCKSKVAINNTAKNEDFNHLYSVPQGTHNIKIDLKSEGKLCLDGFEDEIRLFAYYENDNVLLSENTLFNATISKKISFVHLFKPSDAENFDNSMNIEMESLNDNYPTFSYVLKKVSFDSLENSKSSELYRQKIFSKKIGYISNNQINTICNSLKENEVCQLTMTFEPSIQSSLTSPSKFSVNLNKNGYYIAKELSNNILISSGNAKKAQYFYVDINKENNYEILVNSYERDVKINYDLKTTQQDDEKILPLKTTYSSSSNKHQIKLEINKFTNCKDFCRLYIGVISSQDTKTEEISNIFSIGYQEYDEENIITNDINIPLNYFIQYTFKDLNEIRFNVINPIDKAKLTFELYIIKQNETDTTTAEANIEGVTSLKLTSDSKKVVIGSLGKIDVLIKPNDENIETTFKFRVSTIGTQEIIPIISSYEERCLEPPCYYLLNDLILDNQKISSYFYIPDSETSVIKYLDLEYDKDINIKSIDYKNSKENIKKSNWLRYTPDKNLSLILMVEEVGSLCNSYYNNPNEVTLNYGEKRMFTIKKGSSDSMKIKINKPTVGNHKYIINLHSIIGNGIFKTKNKNYYLGLENAYKQDISIIFDNDKKYDMEFEVINKKFDIIGPDTDFVFTIEYTVNTESEIKYEIIFDKRNSFNFYKSVNFEQLSFYLDRKTITSENLNMNIKIYSMGKFDIKSYFVDYEFKNTTDIKYLDEKIFTYIQIEGFTFAKLEISSDILKSNESPYIFIQISPQKNSGSNIVQIDLYPYNMINTNSILADELYTQKFPSNTLDYQLLLEKSEINYGNNAIINFILPPGKYQYAIAQTSDGKQIIQKDEENLVENSEQKEGFIQKIINLSKEKTLKYLSFNIYLNEKSEKSAPFIITYQNHRFNEEYLYNHYNLSFEIDGKEKSVDYKVIAVRPKYSTGKNILIVKAYDIEKVNKYSNVENEHKSLYLLFNNEIKPDFTFSKELDTDPSLKPLKTITDTSIKAGEYYFIAVSVILDNGREQYLGFKGLSYKVDNSSFWGKISDYMKNHVFTSIIIIIIILFMLGIMVNICRAEKRKPRPTVNIDIQGKMMEDKE